MAAKALSENNCIVVKERCQKFLIQACKQLLFRLAQNLDLFKKIQNLSRSLCLSHMRPAFDNLPLALADQSKLTEIESQWRLLLTLNWEQIFEGSIPTDGAVFWKKAITVKNAGGDVVLKDLAQFALKVYSLPISNAVVERIFSRVGSVKTKLRSRMGLNLLTSILRIKTSLKLQGNCCSSFQPTEQMLSFDSSIYKDAQARADELVAEEEELMEALV